MRTSEKRKSLYAFPLSLPSHFQTFSKERKGQISIKTTVRQPNSELLLHLFPPFILLDFLLGLI